MREAMKANSQAADQVGVISVRNLRKHVCRCWGYELEDTILSIHNGDMHAPNFTKGRYAKWEPKGRRFLERIFDRRFYSEPRNVEQLKINQGYDLFFAFCQEPNDIRLINNIKGWRSKCDVSICWLEELWLNYAINFPKQLELLHSFDHVFVSLRATAEYLQEQGFKHVHPIAPGVDAIRFSPFPHMPARTIDIMAMGRRAPKTHAALYDLSEQGKIFYRYDSSALPKIEVPCEHRTMMANQIKRTKFFIVQRAKTDEPNQTRGQDEIGSRYFEGCAAGAILVGDKINSKTFQEQFPWEDAQLHLPFDAEDVSVMFDNPELNEERMQAIHVRNATESLRRHDWAYRWKFMLDTASIPISQAHQDRIDQLHEFADAIESGTASSSWIGRQATT